MDYRLHRNIPEPLFHQYAYNNRKDANWERDLRKLYEDRRTGIAPRRASLRPPQGHGPCARLGKAASLRSEGKRQKAKGKRQKEGALRAFL